MAETFVTYVLKVNQSRSFADPALNGAAWASSDATVVGTDQAGLATVLRDVPVPTDVFVTATPPLGDAQTFRLTVIPYGTPIVVTTVDTFDARRIEYPSGNLPGVSGSTPQIVGFTLSWVAGVMTAAYSLDPGQDIIESRLDIRRTLDPAVIVADNMLVPNDPTPFNAIVTDTGFYRATLTLTNARGLGTSLEQFVYVGSELDPDVTEPTPDPLPNPVSGVNVSQPQAGASTLTVNWTSQAPDLRTYVIEVRSALDNSLIASLTVQQSGLLHTALVPMGGAGSGQYYVTVVDPSSGSAAGASTPVQYTPPTDPLGFGRGGFGRGGFGR